MLIYLTLFPVIMAMYTSLCHKFRWTEKIQIKYSNIKPFLKYKFIKIYIKSYFNRNKTIPFNTTHNDKTMLITWGERNEYHYMLPYNRRKVSKMSKYEIFLIKQDGTEINITQPHGTLYKYTAEELGGINYRIYNMDDESNTISNIVVV